MDDEIRIEILNAFREGKLNGEPEAWRSAILLVNERFPDLDKLQAANKLLEILIRVDDQDHGLSPAPFVIDAHLAAMLHEEARKLMIMPDRLLSRIVEAWLALVGDAPTNEQRTLPAPNVPIQVEDVPRQKSIEIVEDAPQAKNNTEIITSVKAT